jgi:hypothetical protein
VLEVKVVEMIDKLKDSVYEDAKKKGVDLPIVGNCRGKGERKGEFRSTVEPHVRYSFKGSRLTLNAKFIEKYGNGFDRHIVLKCDTETGEVYIIFLESKEQHELALTLSPEKESVEKSVSAVIIRNEFRTRLEENGQSCLFIQNELRTLDKHSIVYTDFFPCVTPIMIDEEESDINAVVFNLLEPKIKAKKEDETKSKKGK